MTDQPDHKTCLACHQVFYRRLNPRDNSFRWMRRKYCSTRCARSMVGRSPRPAPAAPTKQPEAAR